MGVSKEELIFKSSAKCLIETLAGNRLSRSFIKIMKRRGPITDPCWTPVVRGMNDEKQCPMTIHRRPNYFIFIRYIFLNDLIPSNTSTIMLIIIIN